jgi:hypothetical protein
MRRGRGWSAIVGLWDCGINRTWVGITGRRRYDGGLWAVPSTYRIIT